jgi:hypothetical protein
MRAISSLHYNPSVSENKRNCNDNNVDWEEMVSATETRNYLLRDPLLDWLKKYSSFLVMACPQFSSVVTSAACYSFKNGFIEYIISQGVEFEKKVIEHMRAEYGDVITEIGGDRCARSMDKVRETLEAMNNGAPIIHSGVLHNYENNTYGVPDLIVRSDWFSIIFGILSHLSGNEKKISATLLTDPNDRTKQPPYHYRIIDIKYSTLYLRADGKHLLNTASYPAYKGQMYIYNEALAKIQGYNPNTAYILGRKWKYTTQGMEHRGDSCLDRLGVIDFTSVDAEYVVKTKNAIRWILDMRKFGSKWRVDVLPLIREELYPNMANTYDYPWHQVKEKIADTIKEITSLWMCGTAHRVKAHDYGVYSWLNPRCTPQLMGMKEGGVVARTLDHIISINRDSRYRKIEPRYIQNNDYGWQKPRSLEFFVDFETINDIFSDFSQMPRTSTVTMIFNIGIGYVDRAGAWMFKSFIVNDLTLAEEKRICEEFSTYVKDRMAVYDCPDALFFHWSPAESWQWAGASERNNITDNFTVPSWLFLSKHGEREDSASPLQWFDLHRLFKTEPIVIKGCLGFGLKAVSKAMKEHEFIQTTWDASSSCYDGTSAMLEAHKACVEAKRRGVPMASFASMREIAKYNEVDCKVMCEILTYLRKNHVYVDEIYEM